MPVDEAAVKRLLGWDGIGQSIEERLRLFEDTVRANAPYRAGTVGVHLVDTIDHTREEAGADLISHVGTNPHEHIRGYAIIVHRGSRPHQIRPRAPRQSLRFRVAGRIVYAARVNHPGTHPDPFLTRWIKEITK